MKLIKFLSISFFLLVSISVFLFFNIGHFLDVSEQAKKSDLIVCLGGGKKSRIKKSLELYSKNYSSKNILLLTGDDRSKKRKEKNMPDKRVEYIKENNFDSTNIIHEKNLKSTKDEILYIKNFMLDNKHQSAIIVSDAPHTRRIQTLTNLLSINGDEKLKFNLVASSNDWWDKDTYYTNKKAQVFVLFEVLKLGHAYLVYGLLDKISISNTFENIFSPIIKSIEQNIYKTTYFYLKDK